MVIYNHYITTTVNHNIASHHCIVPYTDKHFSFSPLLHFQVFSERRKHTGRHVSKKASHGLRHDVR